MSEQQLHVKVALEDASLWATIDEFPGVFATGDNLDELRGSLEEGLPLVLERDGQLPVVTIDLSLQSEPVATTATAALEYA